jgi:multisubunit Na+/H+ antiporter MnhE subunit
VVAGVDVAARVLAPRLRIAPGTKAYGPRYLRDGSLTAFGCYASLVPGTLPAGAAPGGDVLVHCLDRSLDIEDGLRQDELLLARALGGRDLDE